MESNGVPTLEEVLSNPNFTDEQKAEYRAMCEQHERKMAELDAEKQRLDAKLRRLHFEVLEMAMKGTKVHPELLEKAMADFEAFKASAGEGQPAKDGPKEIGW